MNIKPQDGFQYDFLSSSADIVIGGGAAGAGKSWALLMECLRHTVLMPNPEFGAVIFRRTFPEIMNQGGLWDESEKIFYSVGATPIKSKAFWTFPGGSKIAFSHLQHEKHIFRFQGSQIPFIAFDELTHFTESMFFYLLTRNRSTCGVKPYMRATCNPDPDSWLARFLEWWIDQDTGYPISERAGKIRYFIKDDEAYIWGNTREEVSDQVPHLFNDELFQGDSIEHLIKSVTFIPGTIDHNKELQKNNPEYKANLLSQDSETQMRLLRGNWKLRVDKLGLYDPQCLRNMFTNDVQVRNGDLQYIVIDHARFGNDFCVIGTWKGWYCQRVDILPISDTMDIMRVIKLLRMIYRGIPTSQIMIDQDGIGVKDTLQCRIFQGGSVPRKLPRPKQPKKDYKEQKEYANRKTQCAFILADVVNENKILIDEDNVWFHYSTGARKSKSIIVKKSKKIVKDLFFDDLRTIKRENFDLDQPKRITAKESQKSLLGRSPDFGDMLIMRADFDMIKQPKGLSKL